MEFHPAKCNVIHITRSQNVIHYNYQIYNTTLEVVNSVKYLGIEITGDLRWNKHITNTRNKATGALHFLQRNLRISSTKVKTTAYQSLVRPRLEYAASVWDPYTQGNIDRLEMVQRRAARWVLGRYHQRSSVGEMLEQLQWPTLQKRRTDSRLLMLYKMRNSLVDINTSAMLKPLSSIASSVNPHRYSLPYASTDIHKPSFFPRTISQWNDLAPGVALAETPAIFKRRLSKSQPLV